MAEAKYSPVVVPTIALSRQEIDEMYDLIDKGELPKDYVDRYFEAVGRNVFGHDARKDRRGKFIEQGLGSPLNQTRNSIDAYIKNQLERRAGGPEPGFEENVKIMEEQLVASNERRAAEQAEGKPGKRRYVA